MDISVETDYTKHDIIGKVAGVLRRERAMPTIESAVDKAGITPDEVNARFGSMHALILEMVSDLSGAIMQPLHGQRTDGTVRDVLVEFGNRLAEISSTSHLSALYRIALTEAARHSHIGREFFKRGPGTLATSLAHCLEHFAPQVRQARLDDSKRIADVFLSLVLDTMALSDAVTTTGTPTNDDSDDVRHAAELLFRGLLKEGR